MMINPYVGSLASAVLATKVRSRGSINIDVELASRAVANELRDCHARGGKVVLVGNGGSAAIASHTAIDLCKNAGVRAMALNDAAALTCLANDLGYEHAFAHQIRQLGRRGDTLVAISSSGRSASILNAVATARDYHQMVTITMSGFAPDNPLRASDVWMSFYVPSDRYGFVELAHHVILHAITDALCAPPRYEDIRTAAEEMA
jgi:D-sedoheptulose 7-phosphate isomerase